MNRAALSRVASYALVLFLLAGNAAAALQHRVDGNSLAALDRPLRAGAKVSVTVPLADGEPAELQLEEFNVLASDAVIEVHRENGTVERVKPQPMQQFQGSVVGVPESLVYLSTDGRGVQGLVFSRDRKFTIQTRLRAGGRGVGLANVDREVFVEEMPVHEEALSTGGFMCEVEGFRVSPAAGGPGVPQSLSLQGPQTNAYSWTTSTATTMLNLIVDADSAMYANMGSNSATVETYVRNLLGAAATIYKRDLRTQLRIVLLSVWTSGAGADPFAINPGVSSGTWNGVAGTAHTTEHALAEYGDWVHANRAATKRSAAMLLSGQSQLAGVAWIETICSNGGTCSNGACDPPGRTPAIHDGHRWGSYSYNGGVGREGTTVPNPDGSVNYVAPSSNYWSLLQVSHELGHNVQSGHTHCIDTDPLLAGMQPVDACVGGCVPQGSVPAEKGTIMSYCHLRTGGGTNTRYTFGQPGELSAVVLSNMRGYLDQVTPVGLSAITAPASVTIGNAANASVTLTNGLTYDWRIANGVINSGGATNAISFTATASPVTLRVTATNANGCGVSDVVTITANADACTQPAINSQPSGQSINTGAQASLSVAATGTATLTYQWYRGASGVTTDPVVGATAATLNISPASTTTFWVRVTNSCGTANSTAATVTVTAPCNAPAINAHPAAQSITSGSPATLSVTATGTATLTYQWYRGVSGTITDPVSGATSATLNISPVSTTSYWVRVSNGCGVANSTAATVTVNAQVPSLLPPDFNANGHDDLLWREPSTGKNVIWFMNGTTRASYSNMLGVTGAAWNIAAVGNFNGDAHPDIVWRNSSTGANTVWLMNGITRASYTNLPALATSWKITGAGDFNADGKSDILVREQATGNNAVWLMNGTSRTSVVNLLNVAAPWIMAGAGDFNSDGKSDIVWRNPSTGANIVWMMNGTTRSSFVNLLSLAGSAWTIGSIGDFNNDGKSDLVWQNTSTGVNEIWLMNGTTRSSAVALPSVPTTWFNQGPR